MIFTVCQNQMSTIGQSDRGIWRVYNLGMGTISTMGSSTLCLHGLPVMAMDKVVHLLNLFRDGGATFGLSCMGAFLNTCVQFISVLVDIALFQIASVWELFYDMAQVVT